MKVQQMMITEVFLMILPKHFKYISSCTELPIVLYNVPGRTGSNMLAETTLKLADIPNIVAIKEASGNMDQIMEIIRLRKPDFGVISGDDAITMPLITAGADGVWGSYNSTSCDITTPFTIYNGTSNPTLPTIGLINHN